MVADRTGWRGSVAETETPGIFSASLQRPGDVPFGSVIGPSRASAARALAWARERADVVTVREGSTFYSAGAVARPGLPEWPGEDRPKPLDPHPQAEAAGPFEVLASAFWVREDREEVCARLARALSERDGVARVASGVRGKRFQVQFAIESNSLEHAQERGSWIVAEAWLGLGVEVGDGDIEVSGLSVHPEGASPTPLFFEDEDDW